MQTFFTKFTVLMLCIMTAFKMQGQISLSSSGGTTNGNYTTLSAAFAAINAGTHTGTIVVQVNGNTTEPAAPVALLASGQGTTNYSSLLIQPTVAATIAGATSAGSAVVNLDGADNVTIDGSVAGGTNDLTIENTAAATVSNVAAIRLIGRTTGGFGTTNVTIRNCILKGNTPGNNGSSGSTATATYGIYVGSTTATTMANGTGSADHDNLLIENNQIMRAYIGVHVVGLVAPNQNDNLIIRNNMIGSVNTVDEISFRGITIQQADTALIANNEVFNLSVNTAISNAGIEVGGSASLFVTISANKIYNIRSRSTSGYGAYGVNITNGSNTVVVNNVIYGVETSNYNSVSTTFNAFGIRISGGTGHKLWYNSVNMFGNIAVGGSTTNAIAAAFVVTSTTVTGIEVKNNIFSMKMTSTASTPEFFAVWFPTGYNFLNAVLDNNAYHVPAIPGCFVGKIGATFAAGRYLTLSDWRTVSQVNNANNDVLSHPTGGNSAAPFTSDTDLTIPAGTSTPLESGGLAITALGIPNIDHINLVRPAFSGTAPDIGAYEFDGSAGGDFVPPTLSSLLVNITGSACVNSARIITVTATDNVGLDSVVINYAYNGVAQTPILMSLTAGSAQNGTWTGTIPAATSNNTSVSFSVFGIDSSSNFSANLNGTAYRDAYLTVNAFNAQTINVNTTTNVQAITNDPNRIKIVISEVVQFKTGTGAGTYPPYIPTADNDYVEVSNLSTVSANLSGYVLNISGSFNGTYTFPNGVILPPNSALVLAFTGTNNDFANRYFEMGLAGTTSSTNLNGYILRNPSGAIVDVVALNGYAFPVGSGVTTTDWSGNIPTSSAGVRRTAGVDGNTATDWAISSTTNLTDIGVYNTTLLPVTVTTFFSWSPGGATTDTIIVGPYVSAGVNVITATYSDGVCTVSDTVAITVINPTPPVADFSATPLLTVTGSTVQFTDLSQNVPSSWSWAISPASFTYTGGTSASSQNPQVQFSAVGVYSVTLTATNGAGSDDEIKVNYITVIQSYCASNATNTADTDIGNVTFGTLNNGNATPTVSNPAANRLYTDFTSLPVQSYAQGVTYPFSMTQITSGATFYDAYCNVFIDWNQDGTFDPVTERAYTGGSTNVANPTLSSTIAVPATATVGITRMRVILNEAGTATDAPCGTYSYGETEDYLLNITLGNACSGTPSITDVVASDSTVCSNQTINFSLSTSYTTTGLSFQWQSSTDGISYTNIAGATNTTYSGTQTVNTYYQCIISCTNSGLSVTSNVLYVTMNSFLSCYCGSASNSNLDTDIGNITFGGINNGIATPTVSNPTATGTFSDFTSLPALDFAQGNTYTFSMTQITSGATFYDAYVNVFIDWNQDGTFDPVTERAFNAGLTTVTNPTLSGNILIPSNSTLGNTRMRVILNEAGTATDPSCGNYGYGETEDYLINIIPCSSAQPTANGDTICLNESVTLTALGNSVEWFDAAVAGTSLATGSSYTSALLSSNTTFYVQSTDSTCRPSSRIAVEVYVTNITTFLAPVNAVCNASNGAASILLITGATAPLSYIWTTGETSASISGLTAGNYTLTVTDVNGCSSIASAGVGQVLNTLSLVIAANSLPVCTAANGLVSVTTTQGLAPYTYLWSNGGTTSTITGLTAGNYFVTMTDANGCTGTISDSINTDNGNLAGSTNAISSVCTAFNGAATAIGALGTLPYNYIWSNGVTSDVNSGLASGSYVVTISDANGCVYVETVTVGNNTVLLTSSSTVTDASGATTLDGSIDLTVNNGTAPYTYIWSDGSTTEDLTSLNPGSYSVTFTDANGCTGTESFVVSQPTPIEAISQILNANLYPNPAGLSTTLDVKMPALMDLRIRLFSAVGQLIESVEYTQVQHVQHGFDLVTLPSALYFVEIRVQDKVHTIKLVVKKD